jgi:hypothetical protein
MSRRIIIPLTVLLCLLGVLNAIALVLNFSPQSRAAVAGMTFQSLASDPDFTRAVKAIVQECRTNLDTASIKC